ncbi:uncharacterized protein LOC125491009 [Plutella xylostella]|uniref:uncharacterized protein LOC125491009 n=1 Tax=Plutella xylostella TaxID=51655 RepID=UPI002032E106|nr:uncharacterized protein LOC125491009 [Plutella xylostella]
MPRTTTGDDGEAVGTSGPLTYTEELVAKFSGCDQTDSAARWAQEVDDNAEIFGWTELQRLIVGRRSLTGTAALWLRSEKPFKTWEALKTAVTKEFPDTVDSKTIHELMSSRKKKANETCLDYMLLMKELGKRGKMPDYVAIKYIVDGILDDELHKVMLYGATTYSELKDKLKIYETVKAKMKTQQQMQHKRWQPSDAAEKSDRRKCYSCGEISHISPECPHKNRGMKCFRCNSFGHISSECRQQPKYDEVCNGEIRKSTTMAASATNDANFRPTMRSKRSSQQQPTTSRQTLCIVDSLIEGVNEKGERCQCQKQQQQTIMSIKRGEIMENKTIKDEKKDNEDIKRHTTVVEIRGKEVNALIDSGSDANVISMDLYQQIGSPECFDDNKIYTGLGSQVKSVGECLLNGMVNRQEYKDINFAIMATKDVPHSMILGNPFLKNVTCLINDGKVMLLPTDEELIPTNIGYQVDKEVKQKVKRMVQSYEPKTEKDVNREVHQILKDEIPVIQRPIRLALKEQRGVEKQAVKQFPVPKVVHCSGSRMQLTGELRCNPTNCIISECQRRIRRMQAEYESLKVIMEMLKEKGYQDYCMSNGLLHKGMHMQLITPRGLKGVEMKIIKRLQNIAHRKKKVKEMKRKEEKKIKRKKTRKKKRKEVILGERKIKVMMNE